MGKNIILTKMLKPSTQTKQQPQQPAGPPQKEYPFVEPTLYLPDWVKDGGTDMVYEGGQYIVLPNQANQDPKAILYIDVRVYKELQIIWKWAEKNSGEIAWFMPTHRLSPIDPHYLAWGYFLAGQDASGAAVDMDGPDCDRYFEYLSGKYEHKHVFEGKFHKHITHCHKHPPGAKDWSGIDKKQQETREGLGHYDQYRWFFLYTPPNLIKADMMVYEPTMYREENTAVGLFIPEGGSPDVELHREKELHAICERLVARNVYPPKKQNMNQRLGYIDYADHSGGSPFQEDYRDWRVTNDYDTSMDDWMREDARQKYPVSRPSESTLEWLCRGMVGYLEAKTMKTVNLTNSENAIIIRVAKEFSSCMADSEGQFFIAALTKMMHVLIQEGLTDAGDEKAREKDIFHYLNNFGDFLVSFSGSIEDRPDMMATMVTALGMSNKGFHSELAEVIELDDFLNETTVNGFC